MQHTIKPKARATIKPTNGAAAILNDSQLSLANNEAINPIIAMLKNNTPMKM